MYKFDHAIQCQNIRASLAQLLSCRSSAPVLGRALLDGSVKFFPNDGSPNFWQSRQIRSDLHILCYIITHPVPYLEFSQ